MIAAYGKLPISKEYVRHECYQGLSLEVREWMDRGFDVCVAAAKLPPDRGHAFRLVYSSPAGVALIVIKQSQDAGGTRRFPFAVMRFVADAKPALERISSLRSPFSDLTLQFDALCDEPTLDSFFERARSLEDSTVPDDKGRWQEFAATPAREWIDSLYRFDPQDLWIRALWHLRYLGDYLDKPRGVEQLNALRVPLSRKQSELSQVEFWTRLLARFHAHYRRMPSVALPQASKRPSGAWLLYRPLTPLDLCVVLGGDMEREHGIELGDESVRLPSEGIADFRQRMQDLTLRDGVSIADLVDLALR